MARRPSQRPSMRHPSIPRNMPAATTLAENREIDDLKHVFLLCDVNAELKVTCPRYLALCAARLNLAATV